MKQTLKDLEIICVDDGSTDKSLKILSEFRDKRVVIMHQKNRGASGARNAGLAIAGGEYVTFVDSDDWVDLNGFKVAYDAGKENSVDVVFFGMMYRGHHKNVCVLPRQAGILKGTEAGKYFIPSRIDTLSACTKLYRTGFLRNNNMFFNVKLRNLEDVVFNFNLFCVVKSIYCVQKCFYNYIPMSSGLSHTFKVKNLDDFHQILTKDLKKMKNVSECANNLSEEHVKLVEKFRRRYGIRKRRRSGKKFLFEGKKVQKKKWKEWKERIR